jgi:sugar diacid utilization regulator/putative methionine-R-sulfoxide reductase with GAF domain
VNSDALAEALRQAEASAAEVRSLRSVATRILADQELEAALSSVTHEALDALQADIAGVFLREGDAIVMRGCAGNRSRHTAKLTMQRHQGLAGLVFATGEAARVDDYLRSELISEDFHDLARAEDVQSALGAPLTLRGEVTGVLEVWRRRRSVFTPVETERLVALAELGAIALNNARLHEAKAASMREVELAHRQVEVELRRVEHALRAQQDLVTSILDGGGLAGTLRIAAQHADADVLYLDHDLATVATYPPDVDAAGIAAASRGLLQQQPKAAGSTVWGTFGVRSLVLRRVVAGDEHLGWLAFVAAVDPGDEALELALTQASLTCSLNHLEEQAAARARAGAQEELLLGLLHGSPEERRAAASRIRYLQLDLRGELVVLVCALDGLAEVAGAEGWTAAQTDAARRRLVGTCRAGPDTDGRVLLAAPRGDTILVLFRAGSRDGVRAALAELSGRLVAQMPGLRPAWGVSAPHRGPMELADAYEEAETATRALKHVQGRRVSFYDELGILRLMLADPRSTDLSRFVTETVGPVVDYDREHGTGLLDTLRAYVEVGCSQQDAAARLFVHAKTVKYRLTQVESLTGLDLASHHDRLRVDIAVRAAGLFQPDEAE